jgi:hypothetical protein
VLPFRPDDVKYSFKYNKAKRELIKELQKMGIDFTDNTSLSDEERWAKYVATANASAEGRALLMAFAEKYEIKQPEAKAASTASSEIEIPYSPIEIMGAAERRFYAENRTRLMKELQKLLKLDFKNKNTEKERFDAFVKEANKHAEGRRLLEDFAAKNGLIKPEQEEIIYRVDSKPANTEGQAANAQQQPVNGKENTNNIENKKRDKYEYEPILNDYWNGYKEELSKEYSNIDEFKADFYSKWIDWQSFVLNLRKFTHVSLKNIMEKAGKIPPAFDDTFNNLFKNIKNVKKENRNSSCEIILNLYWKIYEEGDEDAKTFEEYKNSFYEDWNDDEFFAKAFHRIKGERLSNAASRLEDTMLEEEYFKQASTKEEAANKPEQKAEKTVTDQPKIPRTKFGVPTYEVAIEDWWVENTPDIKNKYPDKESAKAAFLNQWYQKEKFTTAYKRFTGEEFTYGDPNDFSFS